MKATKSFLDLRAYVAFVVFSVLVSVMASCSPDTLTPDPIPVYTKAVVVIKTAEKVTETSATVVARVIPNEVGTSISFEYKTVSTTWVSVTLPTTFSGKDSITVTSDLSGLSSGTDYSFRVKASNKGGESVSYESNFKTGSYLRPVVVIKSAEKVKLSSATIVAKVVPNQDETQVSFEYKTADTDWIIKNLPLTFKGKDSITVTFDLSDLKAGTVYSFRVRAKNVGGESVSSDSKFETYSVSDFDGNGYHVVTIGTQTWLRENFKGTHYANGDAIANVTDPTTWSKLTTAAYCYYNNDPKIGEVYGTLYNWYVGSDPRGLIIGWHVPVGREFSTLKMFLGGYYPAGPALMEAGTSHWQNPARPGNNSTGFTAIPNGGFALSTISGKYEFMGLGEDVVLWTSDEAFGLGATTGEISIVNCWFVVEVIRKQAMGAGIRLLKN